MASRFSDASVGFRIVGVDEKKHVIRGKWKLQGDALKLVDTTVSAKSISIHQFSKLFIP